MRVPESVIHPLTVLRFSLDLTVPDRQNRLGVDRLSSTVGERTNGVREGRHGSRELSRDGRRGDRRSHRYLKQVNSCRPPSEKEVFLNQ